MKNSLCFACFQLLHKNTSADLSSAVLKNCDTVNVFGISINSLYSPPAWYQFRFVVCARELVWVLLIPCCLALLFWASMCSSFAVRNNKISILWTEKISNYLTIANKEQKHLPCNNLRYHSICLYVSQHAHKGNICKKNTFMLRYVVPVSLTPYKQQKELAYIIYFYQLWLRKLILVMLNSLCYILYNVIGEINSELCDVKTELFGLTAGRFHSSLLALTQITAVLSETFSGSIQELKV